MVGRKRVPLVGHPELKGLKMKLTFEDDTIQCWDEGRNIAAVQPGIYEVGMADVPVIGSDGHWHLRRPGGGVFRYPVPDVTLEMLDETGVAHCFAAKWFAEGDPCWVVNMGGNMLVAHTLQRAMAAIRLQAQVSRAKADNEIAEFGDCQGDAA